MIQKTNKTGDEIREWATSVLKKSAFSDFASARYDFDKDQLEICRKDAPYFLAAYSKEKIDDGMCDEKLILRDVKLARTNPVGPIIQGVPQISPKTKSGKN